METIRIIVVEPQMAPVVKEVPATLESYQSIVGGYIECAYPFKDAVCVVCNEEGKNLGLEPNRALKTPRGRVYDVIAGTFFVVGTGEEDFISLTKEQAERYMKYYEVPDFCIVDCGGMPTMGVKK